MDSSHPGEPVSVHLRIGLATIGVAVGYVIIVLLFGWPTVCMVMPLTLLTLLYGAIAVLRGLRLKANHQRSRLWKHVVVLVAITAFLGILTVGPGHYLRLIDLRTRLAVMRTGGRDELQTWAMGILREASNHMTDKYDTWTVPREQWSEQVRRLGPKRVHVHAFFENDQAGVCLFYGGGFLHWSIVVGPPGSRPDPKFDAPDSDNYWLRWADGLYDWFQE